MSQIGLTICILLTILNISQSTQQNQQHKLQNDSSEKHEKILSRKKRFLVFPIGSSFSVATCMTIGVYGNPQFSIWSWAVNYGFAYNLPTNASLFLHPPQNIQMYPFYNQVESQVPFYDTSTTTEEPSTTASTPTEESIPLDSHEAFTDSSVDDHHRRKFHVYSQPSYRQQQQSYRSYMSPSTGKYETQPMMLRRYRREIYQNIEGVINKIGYNGRDCVLQALCESSMIFKENERRTMVQELIRTVFSMPKSKVLSFEHPEHKIYDEAYRNGFNEMNCEKAYGKCGFSMIKLILGKYSKPIVQGFM